MLHLHLSAAGKLAHLLDFPFAADMLFIAADMGIYCGSAVKVAQLVHRCCSILPVCLLELLVA